MDDEHFEYDYFNGGDPDERNPEEEHRRRVIYQVDVLRTLRDQMDPFAISVNEFVKLYRLPQHLVMDLARELTPFSVNRVNESAIPLQMKLLCALAFYGSGSYQRVVGRMADLALSQSTVSNCITEITNILNDPVVITRYIRFPSTAQEIEDTIQRNSILGMPRVLGFIDGTLVKIVPPKLDNNREVYYCRKGYTALNVQLICDAELKILDVNARFPGSCNDAYIYRVSGARDAIMEAYQRYRCWFLGDSGYPREPWMHIPLPHAEPGTPEFYYTLLHCHCRNVIERVNGVLKERFRCLLHDRTLHYAPDKAGFIVNACSVLHNFCRRNNLPDPPPMFGEADVAVDEEDVDDEDNRDLGVNEWAQAEQRYLIRHAFARRQGRV